MTMRKLLTLARLFLIYEARKTIQANPNAGLEINKRDLKHIEKAERGMDLGRSIYAIPLRTVTVEDLNFWLEDAGMRVTDKNREKLLGTLVDLSPLPDQLINDALDLMED